MHGDKETMEFDPAEMAEKVGPPARGRKPKIPVTGKYVYKARASGFSWNQIARAFNCHAITIRRRYHAYLNVLRKRGHKLNYCTTCCLHITEQDVQIHKSKGHDIRTDARLPSLNHHRVT